MFQLQNNQGVRRLFRRRLASFSTLFSFGVAGLFLYFLFVRFDMNPGKLWGSLNASNHYLVALAFLIHYTTFIFRGARWRLLLRNVESSQAKAPTVWYCSGLILLSWFVNSVALFRLGDAYRAFVYSGDTKASFPRTIGTVLAERIMDVGLVFVLLVIAAIVLLASGAGVPWFFLGLAALLPVIIVLALLGMWIFRSRIMAALPLFMAQAYQRFYQGTIESFRHMPLVSILGLLGWLAEVGRLFLVAHALGAPLGIPLVIFAIAANSLLTLVPITPGGLGIVELGVAGLLTLSLPRDAAIAVVLLDRSISYLSIIVIGALLFFAWSIIRPRSTGKSAPVPG